MTREARLDPAAETALAALIVVLADNKYFLGRRLSEWAVGAPTLESAVACAALAQEELGHTRPLYSFLAQLEAPGAPVALEHDDDRERTYCLSYLRQRFPSWPYAAAALFLADTALTIMLQGLENGEHAVLRRRASRLIADEPTHAKFALGRIRELAACSSQPALQAALAELLPETLCWFGPAGEPGVNLLRSAGYVSHDNEQLRQQLLDRIAPSLHEAGLPIGIQWNDHGQRWEYPALPWERWSSLERCTETQARTPTA